MAGLAIVATRSRLTRNGHSGRLLAPDEARNFERTNGFCSSVGSLLAAATLTTA